METVQMLKSTRVFVKTLDKDNGEMYMALFHASSKEEKEDTLAEQVIRYRGEEWIDTLPKQFVKSVVRKHNRGIIKQYVKSKFNAVDEIQWMIKFNKHDDKRPMLEEAKNYVLAL